MRKIVFLLFIIISIVCIANNKKELLIPKEAIRIRVIANSNSIEDQKIKSDIKSDVSNFLAMRLFNVDNYQDASNIIQNNIDDVKKIIEKYTNNYEINYGKNMFPEKEYKGVKYSEGIYNSIVIKLGEGDGNNFWCVLFPPLCLIDEEKSDVEYAFLTKELLNKVK